MALRLRAGHRLGKISGIALLRVATYSTFLFENSALGVAKVSPAIPRLSKGSKSRDSPPNGSRAIPPCKNIEIRDFAANRSFSGNSLWQWYEKPGYRVPRSCNRVLMAAEALNVVPLMEQL